MEDVGGPGQGGGVKAMLNKIKEQFRDSHVQLPDGTVPKGKINITKKVSKEPTTTQPASAETPREAGAQGVKAKLAELNSKFSNSFVKLPDGSVPSSSSTPKKLPAAKLEKQDKPEEDLVVQDIPSTPSTQSEASTVYSDYPPKKKSIASLESSDTRVYSDYETINHSDAYEKRTTIDAQNGMLRSPLRRGPYPNHSNAVAAAATSAASSGYNPPPALLEKNKVTKASVLQQEETHRLISTPRPFVPENKTIDKIQPPLPVQSTLPKPVQISASSASRTPTYGIGVSFKPDERGYLEVVKLIPGGPGAKSGRVNIGDKLKMINEIDITQVPIDEFPELISGPIGSAVKLSLLRRREGGGETMVHVMLTRGPCESANGSGPRVLVPKVIAVNPVHLVNTEPLPANRLSSINASSHTEAKYSSTESAKQSPPRSAAVKVGSLSADSYSRDETAKLSASNQGGAFRTNAFSTESYQNDISHHTNAAIPSLSNFSALYSSSSSTGSASGIMSAPSSKRIGVGIIFLNDERGGLQVKRLAEGGPAHASGAIYQGDSLVEINGRDVRGRSVAEIQDEIVGPWNSTVVLGFRRHRPGLPDSLHRVQLARVWDPPQQDTPSRPQAPVRIDEFVRPSKIVEMLFLGDDSVSRNREALRSEGITCIINAARECRCHFEREFAYTHLQFEDSSSENIRKGFDQVSAIISRNMLQGLSSLVHCSNGLSRSAALCIAFLMKEKKATLRQAFHLVKRAKPSISLKHGFYLQLVDYERDLFGFNTLSPMSQEDYFQLMLGA